MRVNKMNAAIVCDGREGVNCLNVATTVATTMLLISKSVIPEFENPAYRRRSDMFFILMKIIG